MKIVSMLTLSIALLPAVASAQSVVPATGGNITITPVQHASVQVEYGGKVIQVDPAQGDFSTVLALVMAGGMALAGVLYADLGGRAYAAMALAAALGGAFVLLARRFVGEQLA